MTALRSKFPAFILGSLVGAGVALAVAVPYFDARHQAVEAERERLVAEQERLAAEEWARVEEARKAREVAYGLTLQVAHHEWKAAERKREEELKSDQP